MADDLPDDLVPVATQEKLPDDLVPVNADLPDDLVPVVGAPEVPMYTGLNNPDGTPERAPPMSAIQKSIVAQSSVGKIMDTFGQGITEGFGPDRLGLSPESEKWLRKAGIFKNEDGTGNIYQAFVEGIMAPAAKTLDATLRGANAIYRGVGDTAIEMGVPRDIVALPDAFMGSPGELAHGIPQARFAKVSETIDPIYHNAIKDRAIDPTARVYHGTSAAPFDQFNTPSGMHFFSFSPEQASNYAKRRNSAPDSAPRVEIANLEITNPASKVEYNAALDAAETKFNADALSPEAASNQRLSLAREILQEKGYDGVLIRSDEGSNLYAIAFDNSQIKDPYRSMQQARELGVVGPELPRITDGTPAEAATAMVTQKPVKTMAAEMEKQPSVSSSPVDGVTTKAGNIRLDLVNTPDEAKNVLIAAAKERGGFAEARQGDIPLAQVDALSQATGIPADELTQRGIGRLMKNDIEVEVAIEAMLQSADDIVGKMQKAAATDDPADLIALQQARMRHNALQEQVAGLTAEWGRTGNVFQQFLEQVKDAKSLGAFLKEQKGESLDDLRRMAKAGAELDPRTQLPRFLNEMRSPSRWDKFIYYWTNSLLSGPFTQTKYVIFNGMFGAYDTAVVTPIAGAIGAARQALAGGKQVERVYTGEAVARAFGILHGTPDAIVASWKALKSGISETLPGERPVLKNLTTEQRPGAIKGTLGKVIGAPSNLIASFDTFARFLGYSSEVWAHAYREVAKGGEVKLGEFGERVKNAAHFPSERAMESAITYSKRVSFTEDLGPTGKALQQFTAKSKIGKVLAPFLRSPINVVKAIYEGTPFAYLDKTMRDNLKGVNGDIARDTQYARLIAGSSVAAMAVNWAMNGASTGQGPEDPKERAIWLLTNKPNSLKIGDYWVSLDLFGPTGQLVALASDLSAVAGKVKEEEYAEAAQRLTTTAMHVFEQTGMQGLFDAVQAMRDPKRYGSRYTANMASGLIPFSSGLRQTASALDDKMRDTREFIAGLKNNIPLVRETNLPARDWLGDIRANDKEDYGAIVNISLVNQDPVFREMAELGLNPTKPDRFIGGVELTPEQYDVFQSTVGPFTRMALERLINQPNWHSIPAQARSETVQRTIEATRKMGESVMQAKYPDLIRQGLQLKVDKLTGKKK